MKRIFKRITLVLLAITLAVFSLFACEEKPAPTEETTATEPYAWPIDSVSWPIDSSLSSVRFSEGDLILNYANNMRVNLGKADHESMGMSFYLLPDGTYAVLTVDDRYSETLTIPAVCNGRSVTEILPSTFRATPKIRRVVIPDSVTVIHKRAFYDWQNLESVTVGAGVKNIGVSAFSGCYRLFEVYNLSSLWIRKGKDGNGDIGRYVLDIYTSLDEESKYWTDENGYHFYENGDVCKLMYYTGAQTELVLPTDCNGKDYEIHMCAFRNMPTLKSVKISNGVTAIGWCAFYGCKALEEVTIGDGVERIENSAFEECQFLESIVVPASVKQVGVGAFKNCISLRFVTIEYGVEQIDKNILNGCYNVAYISLPFVKKGYTKLGELFGDNVTYALKKVEITGNIDVKDYAFSGCGFVEDVVLSNDIIRIGEGAFIDCDRLSSIVIGRYVNEIGHCAFQNCEKLDTVYYAGAAGEWMNISIGRSNEPLTIATRYYYSETQPTEAGNYWHYVDGVPTVWENVA